MHCSAGVRPSKSIPGFNSPIVRLDTPCINLLRQHAPSPTHFNFRFISSPFKPSSADWDIYLGIMISRLRSPVTLQLQRPLPAFASKTNPSNGSDGTNTENANGPPLLTILAGILVFLVVSWIIGSLVLWLVSLFVTPSK